MPKIRFELGYSTSLLNMRTQANECADVQNVMSYVVDLPLLERNGKYNGNVIDMINRDYAAGDAAMNVVST